MPFNRPTLSALIERITTDMESRLPGATVRQAQSNLYALARVHAGAVHALYGYINWASQQLPDTAEAEYLERWASIFGVFRTPAGFAEAEVTFSGSNGAVIPAGTRLQRSDGQAYATEAELVVAGSSVSGTIVAELPGVAGSLAAGEVLNCVNPVAGVNATAPVNSTGLISGSDPQTDDALRAALIQRIQLPPHGGAKHDYEAWAKQVPGVTRAWAYSNWLGDGNVGVFFVRDNDPLTIIPSPAEVAAVEAYLEPLRPVTAHLIVSAPTPVALDLSIRLAPDTTALRTAVAQSIRDLLAVEAVPGGTIRLSHIAEAISDTPGETDHEIVSPTDDLFVLQNEIAVMGTITWV